MENRQYLYCQRSRGTEMYKLRVDVEEYRKWEDYRHLINSYSLKDILLVHDGNKVIQIPSEDIEELRFTGLNTTTLIHMVLHEHPNLR